MKRRPSRAVTVLWLASLFAACRGEGGKSDEDCAATQKACGGACIDVQGDPANCGGCGVSCGAGLVCVAGHCSGSCPTAQAVCQARCVALETDRKNCGSCGSQCAAGQVCSEAACALNCSSRLLECADADGRYCADPKSDSANCGSCGNTCPAGEVCVEGNCESWCGVGLSECSGVCVDKKSDRQNCGACGALCGPGEFCSAGKCSFVCSPGLTECSGICRDLKIDPAHCGACDAAPCAPGEVCSAGKCQLGCGPGLKLCGGLCRDVSTDESNCGDCGKTCAGSAVCKSGVCTDPVCPPGTHACSGVCMGDSDPNACGPTSCTPCPTPPNAVATCAGATCGFTCVAGYVLAAGACIPGTGPIPPRLVSPLTNNVSSSLRPLFKWVLGAGTDGARIDVCRDRACTLLVGTFDAIGTSGTPPFDLPSSTTMVSFVRLFGKTGTAVGTAASAVHAVISRRTPPSAGVVTSWGSMLDLNGDGLADIAVGAPLANTVSTYTGGAAPIASTPTRTLSGTTTSSFGSSVASAGDVDGDGYGDLLVGAPGASSAMLYAGGPSGVGTTPKQTLVGVGQFGTTVAGVGDVNGDGFADVAVGAPAANAIHVYFGSASGLGPTPTTITGAAGSQLGFSLTGAGDVNGDGFADIAAGAPGISTAFVYLGSKAGVVTAPATTLIGAGPSKLGSAVAGAFDTNSDGYCDLVVGAPGSKAVFVYAGSATGIPTAPTWTISSTTPNFGIAVATVIDSDYEGNDEVLVAADSNQAWLYYSNASGPGQRPGWTFDIPAPTGLASFGKSLAGGGYVDGDKYGEVVIGAPSSAAVQLSFGGGGALGTPQLLKGASGSSFGAALAH